MPEHFWEVLVPQMQGIYVQQNFLLESKRSVKKQEGFSLSLLAAFDPPSCTPHLCIVPYERKQSRERSPYCQCCGGRILHQTRAWSSCSGPCSVTVVSLCFTWASRGRQVQNNQLNDNCVILLDDHKMPVKPPIKTRGLPVLHAPHSTALDGIYMAPKCLFCCLMGKLSTTMAELIANDLGRCDTGIVVRYRESKKYGNDAQVFLASIEEFTLDRDLYSLSS